MHDRSRAACPSEEARARATQLSFSGASRMEKERACGTSSRTGPIERERERESGDYTNEEHGVALLIPVRTETNEGRLMRLRAVGGVQDGSRGVFLRSRSCSLTIYEEWLLGEARNATTSRREIHRKAFLRSNEGSSQRKSVFKGEAWRAMHNVPSGRPGEVS